MRERIELGATDLPTGMAATVQKIRQENATAGGVAIESATMMSISK